MRLAAKIVSPPSKPILIFDGDCNFCSVWVSRWRHSTGDRVEYLAFQDQAVAARFPELASASFESAVHLVETDGSVYSGAEAALRALGHGDQEPLALDWYFRWPFFAKLSESVYRFVARHRQLFSFLTRVAWGRHTEPESTQLVRWVFLRGLGVIYLIAFLSLWVQVMGLIGSGGILPANLTMYGYRQEANTAHIGWERYRIVPSLCWFSATDGFIRFQCAAGAIIALALILGIAPAPCLFLLWLIYLSLSVAGREFFSFQWDNLLLETGFLSIFFAPLRWLPRFGSVAPPSKAVVWLLRWLLFRLMLGSGLVKLLSRDLTWRNLTALRFHYETQPLPTWVGWYAHQAPSRVQQFSAGVLFFVELVLPFLIFAPRRLRQVPCLAFVLLQILILLTGNYCFFNLLSILLCVVLLDDAALKANLPRQFSNMFLPQGQTAVPAATSSDHPAGTPPMNAVPAKKLWHWPIQVIFPLTCICILIPVMQLGAILHLRIPWPGPMLACSRWVVPFRSLNNYGLFAVMTTNRLEIVVQGSNDGITWSDYEFKYKPGNLNRRPGFVAPHQPRLDWQMWFAALGDYRQNLWFVEFCFRLLNGSSDVVGLLDHNPFPAAPPRYVRALLYEYHFTDFRTRRRTGAWWSRELKGNYLPVISLQRQRK